MLFGFGTVSPEAREAGSKIYKKEQRCPKYLVLSNRRETEAERVWDWDWDLLPDSLSSLQCVLRQNSRLPSYRYAWVLLLFNWFNVLFLGARPFKHNFKLLCMQF